MRLSTTHTNLPDYVNLDTTSEWYTSALLCSAMESVTLPTRIRPNGGQKGSMALLEAAINTTGKQTIFELRSSVDRQPETQVNGYTNGHAPDQPEALIQEDTELEVSASNFDIAYADGLAIAGDHKFGQVEIHRHSIRNYVSDDMFGAVTPRQTQDEETIVAKFDARSPFPLLDTFPDTLFTLDHATSLDIRAGLVTTSQTKHRVLEIRNMTSRAIEVDEREAMYNDLTEIASSYTHGWDSGSDSGDDS